VKGRGAPSYLSWTSAPASLSFFTRSSASVLGTPALTSLGGAVDEILGVLEAEPGDLADHLDDADLVRAAALEHDRELGLLGLGVLALSACRARPLRTTAPTFTPQWSSSRLEQRIEVRRRQTRQVLDDLIVG